MLETHRSTRTDILFPYTTLFRAMKKAVSGITGKPSEPAHAIERGSDGLALHLLQIIGVVRGHSVDEGKGGADSPCEGARHGQDRNHHDQPEQDQIELPQDQDEKEEPPPEQSPKIQFYT